MRPWRPPSRSGAAWSGCVRRSTGLALGTAEERARAIAGRAESLRRRASSERDARARAAAARAARERGASVAEAVRTAGETALERIAFSLASAEAERDTARTARDTG